MKVGVHIPDPLVRDTVYQPSTSRRSDKAVGRTRWVLAGFLAIVLFFLLTEHRAHLFGFLPYLLLLACPLMHLFHGHGHHVHGASGASQPGRDQLPATGDDHAPR